MRIGVCVKNVPDAGSIRRIDPVSGRLDRSGDGVLNAFDANAIEEGLRLQEAAGDGEVVLVSLGPDRALSPPATPSGWCRWWACAGCDRALP